MPRPWFHTVQRLIHPQKHSIAAHTLCAAENIGLYLSSSMRLFKLVNVACWKCRPPIKGGTVNSRPQVLTGLGAIHRYMVLSLASPSGSLHCLVLHVPLGQNSAGLLKRFHCCGQFRELLLHGHCKLDELLLAAG